MIRSMYSSWTGNQLHLHTSLSLRMWSEIQSLKISRWFQRAPDLALISNSSCNNIWKYLINLLKLLGILKQFSVQCDWAQWQNFVKVMERVLTELKLEGLMAQPLLQENKAPNCIHFVSAETLLSFRCYDLSWTQSMNLLPRKQITAISNTGTLLQVFKANWISI